MIAAGCLAHHSHFPRCFSVLYVSIAAMAAAQQLNISISLPGISPQPLLTSLLNASFAAEELLRINNIGAAAAPKLAAKLIDRFDHSPPRPSRAPPPRLFIPPRFRLSASKAAVAYLEQHGFVVFRSVLTTTQIKRAVDLFWEHMAVFGLRPGEPDEWRRWPENRGVGELAVRTCFT